MAVFVPHSFPRPPLVSTMDPKPQRLEGQDGVRSVLSAAIKGLDFAEQFISVEPAKVVCAIVRELLVMIDGSMANKMDCVNLGLACANVCKVLERGMSGRRANEFSRSVFEAIEQLTAAVIEIKMDIFKLDNRSSFFGIFNLKSDKDKIAAWRIKLDEILQVFNTELAINIYGKVCDIHNVVKLREGTDGRNAFTRPRTSGELPPPPPTVCFGREDLIKKIVGLVESLSNIALIGAGGIGKTSISLTVLHHNRVKQRFGDNRRFIRCDQFQASRAYFLARLSKAIGSGVENPEDLASLRPFLSSKEMLIVLDNAESILDPQGSPNRWEIYGLIEELCRFRNLSLVITSRITTVPPSCKTLKIPTLSRQAACDAFYDIYKGGGRSDSVDDILKQLDFHPLSVTLLATVAYQSQWNNNQLVREWRQRRTSVLRTEHQTSLAAAIELSLASPLFRALGPDARELLGVIAFYPQGVNENNLQWLFPTIPNVTQAFDRFRILSLTYRSGGFVTMLAPLRDHLRPTDRNLPPLLRITKDRYFARMRVDLHPTKPRFNDARWIVTEDANVEHLLYVLTFIDPGSDDIWEACVNFMRHLYAFKPRQTVLRPKIEALPDNHRYKPKCLFDLAKLFGSAGNYTEQRRLLEHALKLEGERRNDHRVALVLEMLSHANQMLGLHKDGIRQLKKALIIYEGLSDTIGRSQCLEKLAQFLRIEGQLDAAEETAVLSIKLLPERGEEFKVCQSYLTLGDIYRSKGQREKAIHHYEVALRIASHSKSLNHLFAAHLSLADLFLADNKIDDAYYQIKLAKSHTLDVPYQLGHVAMMHATILYRKHQLKDARSEVLRALETFENLGASKDVEESRTLLRKIERATESRVPSVGQASTCTVQYHNRNHTSGRI